MAGDSGAPLWKVDKQTETFASVDGGPGEPVVRIAFTTRSGVAGTLDVARTTYFASSPAEVGKLIDARAQQIEDVHALQGPA